MIAKSKGVIMINSFISIRLIRFRKNAYRIVKSIFTISFILFSSSLRADSRNVNIRYKADGNVGLCYMVTEKKSSEGNQARTSTYIVDLISNGADNLTLKHRKCSLVSSGDIIRTLMSSMAPIGSISAINTLGETALLAPGEFYPEWFPILPKDAINSNSTWQSEIKMRMVLNYGQNIAYNDYDVVVDCEVDEISKFQNLECVIISYSYKLDDRDENLNVDFKGKWNYECKGKVWFAVDKGVIVKKKESTHLIRHPDQKPNPEIDVTTEYESVLLNTIN